MTKQRQVIIDMLRSRRDHPTAEEVYMAVKKKLPAVSLGTIYRNLAFLRDRGIIDEYTFGVDKRARYDAFVETHGHFTCKVCGTVRDIEFKRPDLFITACGKSLNHEIHKLQILCTGLCRNCMKSPNN